MRKVLVTTLAALAVLAGLFLVGRSGPHGKHLTVTFPSTTSLYEGAQVKVLGVRVGTVDSIEVVGTAVRVDITYDDDVKLPEDVHAVIVPPSVVGDRFVQLAPAYTGGQVLADGARLGQDRSGVPLELDDTYRALDKISVSLGPRGANKDGALSRLITASAMNLRGRGALINSTVRRLADAISTVAASSGDINATIGNSERITRELAGSDATIRRLVANLVAVSTMLNGQRDDITAAVTDLDRALGRLARLAQDNRHGLRTSLSSLTGVTSALRRHIAELEEMTDLAPVGLVNLMHTYVPRNWDPTHREGTVVDGRTGSQNLHAAGLEDLDTQLSYSFSALCDRLPPDSAEQLAPFCTALTEAGGDLGRLLTELYGGSDGGSPAPLAPSSRELRQQVGP